MLIRHAGDLTDNDVTPHGLYLRRREFMTGAIALGTGLAACSPEDATAAPLKAAKSRYTTSEKLTPFKDVTTYNNFYEFGVDKGDPARNSARLKTRPWTVKVDGACAKPGTYNIEDVLKAGALQE
eukprot:gene17476-17304_t